MKCPRCLSKTIIYNSRGTGNGLQTWRRHRCLNCQQLFSTKEKIEWAGLTAIATEGDTLPYNRDRLLLSIVRANEKLGLSGSTLTDLCDSIELELQKSGFFSEKVQLSSHFTEVVIKVLARFDVNLALQYVNNIYRAQPPAELLKALLQAPMSSVQ